MYLLKTIAEAFCALLGWLWQILTAFWPHLGIDEWIAKNVLTIIILLTLAGGSVFLSKRDKRNARSIANIIVDAVSFLRK